jgi:hypothetical protein
MATQDHGLAEGLEPEVHGYAVDVPAPGAVAGPSRSAANIVLTPPSDQ